MSAVCGVCPRGCTLDEGQTGFCRARANRGGRIVADNYGRLTALALDPIEKKPLQQFHPGSLILSAGSYGCNLRCPFCQNSDISMADATVPYTEVSPQQLVTQALSLTSRGNIGLAFTYNEPIVGLEYVCDAAALAHEAGLQTVLVSNGYCTDATLDRLLPLIDAANIDLKGFTPSFYEWVGGMLGPVQNTIRRMAGACHVEVTTLVIPGRNDSDAAMEAEAAWLASLNPELPLHLSRFFPRYRMAGSPPTPTETLHRLRDVAKQHLRTVYLGNL